MTDSMIPRRFRRGDILGVSDVGSESIEGQPPKIHRYKVVFEDRSLQVLVLRQQNELPSGPDEAPQIAGSRHTEPSLSKSDNFATTPTEPGDAIKVGDQVLGIHSGNIGEVIGQKLEVRWPGYVPTITMEYAENLAKILPKLPPDHIDRFWIVGAWITWSAPDDDDIAGWCVVMDDAHCIACDDAGNADRVTKSSREPLTGVRFHPDSPIQETREPT